MLIARSLLNFSFLYSCDKAWEIFYSNQPEIVAIECEGVIPESNLSIYDQYRQLPCVIKIACTEIVIIEFPIENMNKKYNNNIKDIFVMGDFNTSDDD